MLKTIKASVVSLTKHKKELLDNDYNNHQWWMIFGVDNGLLSCFKSTKNFKQKKINYKEYPLPLWSCLIKDWFRKKDTKLTKDWLKIPNSKLKGQGLWLPLKFHQPIPENSIIKDSCLVLKNNQYYIHFSVEINEPKLIKPRNIIGIDLGLKNPVTLTNLNDKKKRRVNTLLHGLSKWIVNKAYLTKSAIVIGKLDNLPKNYSRKFNRKLNNFPYYKLTNYIEYKAKERGVPTVLVNEAYTSKTCSVCDTIGQRTKNWFKCNNCHYEDNADRNASINIGKRGLSYMLRSGVVTSALKSLAKSEEVSTNIIKSKLAA